MAKSKMPTCPKCSNEIDKSKYKKTKKCGICGFDLSDINEIADYFKNLENTDEDFDKQAELSKKNKVSISKKPRTTIKISDNQQPQKPQQQNSTGESSSSSSISTEKDTKPETKPDTQPRNDANAALKAINILLGESDEDDEDYTDVSESIPDNQENASTQKVDDAASPEDNDEKLRRILSEIAQNEMIQSQNEEPEVENEEISKSNEELTSEEETDLLEKADDSSSPVQEKDSSKKFAIHHLQDKKATDTDDSSPASKMLKKISTHTKSKDFDSSDKESPYEKRDVPISVFDSNKDGYYDDVQSPYPPVADIFQPKLLVEILGTVVVVILFTIFLIYYV